MAVIFSTPTTCQFFIQTDSYVYTVDNRPLGFLLANDIAINTELMGDTAEIIAARSGSETLGSFDNLHDHLIALENVGVSPSDIDAVRNHQYTDFINTSESVRRATPSGFLDQNGIADLAVGDTYDDFGALRTTDNLGAEYANSVVLWTAWGSTYKPIRAVVNGWIIRLFNEIAGTPPTIPSEHVTIGLPAAPATGSNINFVFLEVWLANIPEATPAFYANGSVNTNNSPQTVTNPQDPLAIYTVKAMATGGNWIQVQHRIRVVTNTDNVTYPDGFSDPSILAQGAEGAPVATYNFSPMALVLDDPGLWRAGNGDAPSMAALGSFDGYVYAIPMFMIHRWNQGAYSISNQNGAALTGTAAPASGAIASGISGHPAQMYYDSIAVRDIGGGDMRSKVSISGWDLKSELQKSVQMLFRGELLTFWEQLAYPAGPATGVWGSTLTAVDEISNTPDASTNPLRDNNVTGTPLAFPDGQRTVWGKDANIIYVKFSFTQGVASSSGVMVYAPGPPETITLNAASLSGAGTGGTKIGSSPPIIMEASNLASQATVSCKGLGTQSATVTMGNLTAGAIYTGYVPVVYPGGSGISVPQNQILTHDVLDSGTTLYPEQVYGTTGVPSYTGFAAETDLCLDSTGNYYYVADRGNHRVIKILITTGAITAQFGVNGTTGADNTHLNAPTGLCCDVSGTGNVYVADSGNHRLVQLTSALVYVSQFGVTGTSGADTTHLNSPSYCSTNSTNVYVTDTGNHRLLQLPMAINTISSQFGVTGQAGALQAGLNGPTGVTVVSAGFGAGVWVSDHNNNRIVVLNTSMVYQYQICDLASRNTLIFSNIRMAKDYTIAGTTYFYVLVSSAPDGPVLYQFNESFSLINQFGVAGQPGAGHSLLNFPSGFVVDVPNNWLYIADAYNHRILRLNATTLAYVAQYGIDGVATPGAGRPQQVICPGPADVDVDSSGNIYCTCNPVHVAKKINTALTEIYEFGIWGIPISSGSSYFPSAGLRNPLGIAVKPDGSVIWIVDALNDRVVILNSSFVYTGEFTPQYNLNVLPLRVSTDNGGTGIYDVDYYYDSGTPSDSRWYLVVAEQSTATNTSTAAAASTTSTANPASFAILRYLDAPTNVPGTQNYDQRIVSPVTYPCGVFEDGTSIYTGSPSDGVVIYNQANPTEYVFTKDGSTTIQFRFYDLMGLSSNGTEVLVSEPSVNAVHCFDADIGLYRSSAGIIFEAGNDDGHLQGPSQAILNGKHLVIADTQNHRVLSRHQASPWVAKDGTITTMLPPVGADKVHIYYDQIAYMGLLGQVLGTEAIYKEQVKAESDVLYATTMGLGTPLTSTYADFFHLHGMTFRLPMPYGWNDFMITPVGMKSGTADDTPFLIAPLATSEGYLSGEVSFAPGGGTLSSREALTQIVRTVAGGTVRGYRSLIPTDKVQPLAVVVTTALVAGGQGVPTTPTLANATLPVQTQTFFETLRYGVPPVKADNLLVAVPHLNLYAFLYQRVGVLLLCIIAEATNTSSVSIGSALYNAIEVYYPNGRILVRS